MRPSPNLAGFDPYAYQPDVEPYIRAGIPNWLDELPIEPATPHHRMGTRAVNVEHGWQCLQVDEHRTHELALRNRLIDEQPSIVCRSVPGTERAAEEVRGLVDTFLSANKLPATQRVEGEDPLVAAGREVQEDLVIMAQHTDGGWYLDAAVLCFPSLWSLQQKIGRHIADVHGVVPHYDTDLSDRVDRFFDRLAIGRVVWRRNLSIKPYSLLCLPFAKSEILPVGQPPAPDGSPFWLRTEYQTLQRLPGTGAVLFTIKTQIAPLGVLRGRPDTAAAMVAQLATWSDSMHAYKTAGSQIRENVVPWLQSIAH